MSTSSSPESPKSHCESITSFECPRVPPFVAYRIRPHQVPLIHKRLQTVIPELGYKDNDAARYVQKSLQRDTQVLFVAQDGHDTPQPHEAIMLSMGKGSRVRVYHASRPVTGEIDWFQWVEATAEGLGLQKIELPVTIFSEDIGWMLRAQSASARGLQEHVGDTHLIHRVERFFADVVFVVRRKFWAESNLMSWKRSAMTC